MRLTLRTEHLAALTSDDLADVVGGNQYSAAGLTCPLLRCADGTRLTCATGCDVPPGSVVC